MARKVIAIFTTMEEGIAQMIVVDALTLEADLVLCVKELNRDTIVLQTILIL